RAAPPRRAARASSPERRPEQLLDHLRVRLAARRLHHLADQEAEHPLLARPDLRDLRGMPGDHLRDRRVERATIAHLRETLRRDELLGVAAGAAEPRDDALRGVAVDRALLDQDGELRELRRRDRPL